jgi:glycosyltransferase involved in cell wall biosynthesis
MHLVRRRRIEQPPRDVAIYAPFASPLLTDPPAPGSGGAELQATLLARGLARRGLEVAQIVYPNGGLPARSAGVRVVQRRPPAVGRPAGAVREWAAVWQALHRASAGVYVHRSAGPEVFLTASYCRASGSRFIYSSSATFDFTGEHLARPRRDLRLHRMGMALADWVVVQTRDQERLARRYGVGKRLTVIPSYVEVAAVEQNRQHLLWIGSNNHYKRPDAFVELARAMPDARCVMVLAEKSSHNAIPIADIVAEAKGLENLVVLSAMPREKVLELIGGAVAVVNTSIGEGMPNVFLEAWARAVPTVSLAVDPDGLIREEDLGIGAGSEWSRFVHGARSFWQDPERALAAGRRGRDLVRERHDPDLVTDRWMAVVGSGRMS